MMIRQKYRLTTLALTFLFSLQIAMAEPTPPLAPIPTPEVKKEDPPAPEKLPETSVKQHTLTLKSRSIKYTSRAGYMTLKDDETKPKANIFFTAYTEENTDLAKRPIVFAFNGGPGSSSVWLHMGALGPKRIWLNADGSAPSPPYRSVDNEFAWLDFADLVFIDPVSTGYSRPAGSEEKKQFHGLEEDANWVAEFIRRYTTENKRWQSPKFLAGESYGTTRASLLSQVLHDRHGMNLNGIILISAVLNFQTLDFNFSNEQPYSLFLPTYSATAWFHKKLSPEMQSKTIEQLVDEVRSYSLGEYATILAKGNKLTDVEYTATLAKLNKYTGLSHEYLRETNLRLNIFRFTKELLRKEGRTVGRLDSRFLGYDQDNAGESFEFDPSYNSVIYGPFTTAINQHMRSELGFESELPYEILTGKVHPWNWGSASDGFVDVAKNLSGAMRRNPDMKVFVCNGYYDLATPFFATEYTMAHLSIPKELDSNISMAYYPSGHMMYIEMESLKKFTTDVKGFVEKATK